jgi:hypothetical protein
MIEGTFVFPYFEQPKLHFGSITIHTFGALVATGSLYLDFIAWSFPPACQSRNSGLRSCHRVAFLRPD